MRRLLPLLACAALAAAAPAHALKDDAQQPINIRARNVEVNEKTGVSIYTGNVVLTQGSIRVEADRVEVISRRGRLHELRAWGRPVRLQSRSDAGETLRGRAQRAIYFAGERRIDMYDDVEIHRDGDVFTGGVAHYGLDDQTLVAEGEDGGQVSAVIQPAKKETAP